MGLEHHHEINEEDLTVWTLTTHIIIFSIVELHHSDSVKLQFGMHQEIPYLPRCLVQWHQLKS